MIKRIIYSIIFICCLFALSLALLGVQHVDIGLPFIQFIRNVVHEMESFKWEIPEIPTIEPIENPANIWQVFLVGIVNFINGLIGIINILVTLVNVVLQLIQFIAIVIKNAITFRDGVVPVGSSSESESIFDSSSSFQHYDSTFGPE